MDKNRNKDEPPCRKAALVSTNALLALSGFSFLVGGGFWFMEGFAFNWIGAGALGFGCYLIISALRKTH